MLPKFAMIGSANSQNYLELLDDLTLAELFTGDPSPAELFTDCSDSY